MNIIDLATSFDYRKTLVQALMIGLVTVALIILLASVNVLYFNEPPIYIESLDPPDLGELCPGDLVAIHNQVYVARPTWLYIVISVTDDTRTFNVNSTQRELEPRPHQHAGRFRQTLPWSVPDLSPGSYYRILSWRGHDPEQDPEFLYTKFVVPERCFRDEGR